MNDIKTPEEVLDEVAAENMTNIHQMVCTKQLVILAMRKYAKIYHESEQKNLNELIVNNENMVEKYNIVDNEGNELLTDISSSFFDYIIEVDRMIQLYKNKCYTHAEMLRDELANKLDDIMRL